MNTFSTLPELRDDEGGVSLFFVRGGWRETMPHFHFFSCRGKSNTLYLFLLKP